MTSKQARIKNLVIWRKSLQDILQIIFYKVQQLAVAFLGRHGKTEALLAL